MTWLSYVFFAATLGGFLEYGQRQNTHPLAPWAVVASDPFTWVVNDTPDTLAVFAQAPQVDGAVRFVGWVLPRDSSLVKLPYADAEVLIRIAVLQTGVARMDIYAPGNGRLWVHEPP